MVGDEVVQLAGKLGDLVLDDRECSLGGMVLADLLPQGLDLPLGDAEGRGDTLSLVTGIGAVLGGDDNLGWCLLGLLLAGLGGEDVVGAGFVSDQVQSTEEHGGETGDSE